SCSRRARGDRVLGQPAVKRHCCHWRRARARPAPRCWISSTAPRGMSASGSTLLSSRRPPRRALSPSETSAAGGTCDCSPRPATRNTRDYLGEAEDGRQKEMLKVFHREGEMIRHFWGAELTYAPADPGQDHRGVGTLEPLWNLFDLTPEGRPMDWDEQLSYQ